MYQSPVGVLPSTSTAVGAAMLFTDNLVLVAIGALMLVFAATLIAFQIGQVVRRRSAKLGR